ncbi:MAG: hypothetical protein OEV01_15330 [Nitrospira sp.]|nr:hypothetical protein [Nitrospira sp.]MDH4305447.1 hypothetical protein [Nitrospira sp.]MDH5195075.1 hypothetical protein [Nitrospira sp.]
MKRIWVTILLGLMIIVGMSGTGAATARNLDIDIVTLKSPVLAGEMAELVIRTEIGAMCLGNAWSEVQPSQRVQLSGKTVHDKGQATWSWPVPKSGATGEWKIDLQCATSTKNARLHLAFKVQ